MARTIAIGIDTGTYQTSIVAAEIAREGARALPKVVGVGFYDSRGLRHCYILSQPDAVKSVKQAVAEASKAVGLRIKLAIVSIGGIGLSSLTSTGTVVLRAPILKFPNWT